MPILSVSVFCLQEKQSSVIYFHRSSKARLSSPEITNYIHKSKDAKTILLHIMCGYQCDKAVTKNDTVK